MDQPEDVARLVALVDRLTSEKDDLVAEKVELTEAVAVWRSQALMFTGWLVEA